MGWGVQGFDAALASAVAFGLQGLAVMGTGVGEAIGDDLDFLGEQGFGIGDIGGTEHEAEGGFAEENPGESSFPGPGLGFQPVAEP